MKETFWSWTRKQNFKGVQHWNSSKHWMTLSETQSTRNWTGWTTAAAAILWLLQQQPAQNRFRFLCKDTALLLTSCCIMELIKECAMALSENQIRKKLHTRHSSGRQDHIFKQGRARKKGVQIVWCTYWYVVQPTPICIGVLLQQNT